MKKPVKKAAPRKGVLPKSHVKTPTPKVKPPKEEPAVVVTSGGDAMPPVRLETAIMKKGHATEGDFKPVSSSNIKSVRWERALTIEFHGGRKYTYIGVPVEVWQALMAAASHGKFLGEHIMKKYQYSVEKY